MFKDLILAIDRLVAVLTRVCDLWEAEKAQKDNSPFMTKEGLFNYKQRKLKPEE